MIVFKLTHRFRDACVTTSFFTTYRASEQNSAGPYLCMLGSG